MFSLVVQLFTLIGKFTVRVQNVHWVFKAQKYFDSFMHNCTLWSSLPISNICNCGGDDDISNICNCYGEDNKSNICNCCGDNEIDADIFVLVLSNVSQERTLSERHKGTKSSQKSAATNQKITHELTQALPEFW